MVLPRGRAVLALAAAALGAAAWAWLCGPAPDESAGATTSSPPAGRATVVVTHVVDGDTVDVSGLGRIRVIGIDTPEHGECGYQPAAELMSRLVLAKEVILTAAADKDDHDRYGRLLRYVDVAGTDAGLEEIRAGLAVARYDSRDGFGAHPRESDYVAADTATPAAGCSRSPVAEGPTAVAGSEQSSGQLQPLVAGDEPWNRPGPDLDCVDIGRRVQITGTDYHRLDRDRDGWGCEAYG